MSQPDPIAELPLKTQIQLFGSLTALFAFVIGAPGLAGLVTFILILFSPIILLFWLLK